MAAILAHDIFKCNFVNDKCLNFNQINSTKFVPKGQTNNKSSLVKAMAWCKIDDNPLYEPTMTPSNGAYMRLPALFSVPLELSRVC